MKEIVKMANYRCDICGRIIASEPTDEKRNNILGDIFLLCNKCKNKVSSAMEEKEYWEKRSEKAKQYIKQMFPKQAAEQLLLDDEEELQRNMGYSGEVKD